MCKFWEGVVFKAKMERLVRSPTFWISTFVIDALIVLALIWYFDVL